MKKIDANIDNNLFSGGYTLQSVMVDLGWQLGFEFIDFYRKGKIYILVNVETQDTVEVNVTFPQNDFMEYLNK